MSLPHSLKNIHWKSLIYWGLGIVLMLIMVNPALQWLNRIELSSFDARQQLIQESRTTSGISIVEMDNATLASPEIQQLFGRYPYRRDIYGYFLRFLNRTHPQAVLINQAFSLGADQAYPEADQFLAQSVSSHFPVYASLNSYVRDEQSTQNPALIRKMRFNILRKEFIQASPPLLDETSKALSKASPKFSPDTFSISEFQPPLEVLMDSPMRFYSSLMKYDANGKVRRTSLFTRYSIPTLNKKAILWDLPTLPVAPVLGLNTDVEWNDTGKVRLGKHVVNLRGESSPIIHWYGNMMQSLPISQLRTSHHSSTVYPKYSFWQIIRSQLAYECSQPNRPSLCTQLPSKPTETVSPKEFTGRYVLLGTTATSYDLNNHPTLYDGANGTKYPALYIVANILDNLLHDDFVARPGGRVHLPEWLGKALNYNDSISMATWLTVLGLAAFSAYLSMRWQSIPLCVLAVVALAVLYTLVTVWSYQEYNLWLNWVYPVAGMLVTMSVSFMVRYRQEANRREQLRYAFGKYVSPVVVDALIQHPELLQLKGQRREVTILFCDIRGFTTLSETHDAEYVQQLLTRYFTTMNRIVLQEHRGIINKLIGDAIMAYWGFPLETDDHPYQAVSAALAMQEAIRNWPAEAGEPPITIGIGIHTGEVMVGNVGSEEFMDFTVIGDAVNLASRLEGVNKELGTTIVMSAATWERVKDRLPARSAGTVTVKGKTEAIDVYEPLPLGAAEVLAKLGAKRSE